MIRVQDFENYSEMHNPKLEEIRVRIVNLLEENAKKIETFRNLAERERANEAAHKTAALAAAEECDANRNRKELSAARVSADAAEMYDNLADHLENDAIEGCEPLMGEIDTIMTELVNDIKHKLNAIVLPVGAMRDDLVVDMAEANAMLGTIQRRLMRDKKLKSGFFSPRQFNDDEIINSLNAIYTAVCWDNRKPGVPCWTKHYTPDRGEADNV